MKPFPCVAITGGIGEGKTTVLRYLSDAGYRVASSDVVARQVFDDSAVQGRLAMMLSTDRAVSREGLRAALAADPALRRSVNRLMHHRILARLMQGSPQFVEIPLLIEACLHPMYRRVWVVTCGREAQRERLLARYGEEEVVRSVLSTQVPTRVKSVFADTLVRTNEPEEAVKAFVVRAAEWELR